MGVIAVVPMKLNNRRLPNKNTRSFTNGEPLCFYSVSKLLRIKEIDEIYVFCSNPEIQEYLPEGVKYLKRPEVFDTDEASMNDILGEFAKLVPNDTYMLSFVTSPFISEESIRKGILAVTEGGYDSSFAGKKVQDYLWQDGKPLNHNLKVIQRTQDLPEIYMETCGFCVFKAEVILNLKQRIGENPCIIEVGEIESIDIDEMEDFVIADAIYNFLKKRH